MTDFGGTLREARERKGISLRQIANSTKISVAALEALERNDVSKLPGGIFSRAFVRSYAIEVGLDPDQTVREFLDRFQGEPPAPAVTRQPVSEEDSSFESQQRIASVLLKLVLLSVPLAGGILYYTTKIRPASVNAGAPAALATPSTPTPQATAAPAPAATQPAGSSIKLEIHPSAPCWVSLTVDGVRVFAREMKPGEREIREAKEGAVIEIGDAGAFAYTVNGRPGKPLGGPGEVKTARINRETVQDYVR